MGVELGMGHVSLLIVYRSQRGRGGGRRKTNYQAVTRNEKVGNLGPFSVGENRLKGNQLYMEENNC